MLARVENVSGKYSVKGVGEQLKLQKESLQEDLAY